MFRNPWGEKGLEGKEKGSAGAGEPEGGFPTGREKEGVCFLSQQRGKVGEEEEEEEEILAFKLALRKARGIQWLVPALFSRK